MKKIVFLSALALLCINIHGARPWGTQANLPTIMRRAADGDVKYVKQHINDYKGLVNKPYEVSGISLTPLM